jgi:hypothetical protein
VLGTIQQHLVWASVRHKGARLHHTPVGLACATYSQCLSLTYPAVKDVSYFWFTTITELPCRGSQYFLAPGLGITVTGLDK